VRSQTARLVESANLRKHLFITGLAVQRHLHAHLIARPDVPPQVCDAQGGVAVRQSVHAPTSTSTHKQ
jgi:hypothetical protein